LKIRINDQEKWVKPSTDWKELEVPENAKVTVDANFYIQTQQ
jgi:hypothetical protein